MCDPTRPAVTASGNVRVLATERVDAYVARRVAQRGYVVVIWRGPHAADLTDLDDEQASAYMSDVVQVARAVRDVFGADLVNVQTLGNGVPHLHTHVSARYLVGDVNPGRPLPFESLIELDDEVLEHDARALSVVFS